MIFPSMMKFCLGRLVITPAALTTIPAEEIYSAIDRHVCGQWGDIPAEAHAANERGLLSDAPLRSVYHAPDEREFCILTTGDRLTTTVHLPSDSIANH